LFRSVAQLSDRVAVMYRGQICEIGTAAEVLAPPHHPYTEMLLASAADDEPARPLTTNASKDAAQGGCVFAARCLHKVGAICDTVTPPSRILSTSHSIACHRDSILDP